MTFNGLRESSDFVRQRNCSRLLFVLVAFNCSFFLAGCGICSLHPTIQPKNSDLGLEYSAIMDTVKESYIGIGGLF